MKTLRLVVLLFLSACHCHSPSPGPDLSIGQDFSMPAGPADAAACVSCSQSSPSACGGVPSWCECLAGHCCCKKVGP